jgi:hypothetical protein
MYLQREDTANVGLIEEFFKKNIELICF